MPNRLLDEDGPYSLRVTGSGGLTFRNETSLKVDQKCVSVFIQTDKGIYKPGQTSRDSLSSNTFCSISKIV